MKIETKYDPGQEVWVAEKREGIEHPRITYSCWKFFPSKETIVEIIIGGIYNGFSNTDICYGIYDMGRVVTTKFKESDIFLSEAECQAECDRRNAKHG